jgi:hypothetical protein
MALISDDSNPKLTGVLYGTKQKRKSTEKESDKASAKATKEEIEGPRCRNAKGKQRIYVMSSG